MKKKIKKKIFTWKISNLKIVSSSGEELSLSNKKGRCVLDELTSEALKKLKSTIDKTIKKRQSAR